MAMRAWRVWGSSVVLGTALAAAAKPPEVPVKVDVEGKVPPPIVQEHFQPLLPPPRLLPDSILDPKPRHGPETASESPGAGGPVRASVFQHWPLAQENGRRADWKARAAFDMAEEHRRACDATEARQWYREVIKLAPGSNLAQAALERLREGQVVPAGATETREPPLADSADDIPVLQLQVLWEAARQFKEAVDSGDKLHIEKCGRSLDQVLRQTKPGRNP
jgi:hypothetical protein